jgi:hypothetical protein
MPEKVHYVSKFKAPGSDVFVEKKHASAEEAWGHIAQLKKDNGRRGRGSVEKRAVVSSVEKVQRPAASAGSGRAGRNLKIMTDNESKQSGLNQRVVQRKARAAAETLVQVPTKGRKVKGKIRVKPAKPKGAK